MTTVQAKMRARAQARYDIAIRQLEPAEDQSYDMDEVAEKIADQISIDARVMQLRQAKQDLALLRREEDDDESDGPQLRLNLFGEGRLVDYDPFRLVLGPRNRVVTHHLAPLEYKVEERNRAKLNRELAQAKEAIKAREVDIFAAWSSEQIGQGRDPQDLIWGNCVRETGILRTPE